MVSTPRVSALIAGLVDGGPALEIGAEDLDTLMETARVIREEAGMTGRLRALEFDGRILVQERTGTGQAVLRSVRSAEAALAFIDDRLERYDRMWDGCGCRIDYLAPFDGTSSQGDGSCSLPPS